VIQDKNNISVFATTGNCVTPLGFNIQENIKMVLQGKSGIKNFSDEYLHNEPFVGGIIDKEKLNNAFQTLNLKGEFTDLEQMMLLSVKSIQPLYDAILDDKCGLIISSTKGNITSLEKGNIEQYYLSNLADKVAKVIGVKSTPIVLSNACVSGIMAVSVAKSLIQSNVYNHLIIIGADLFSRFVFTGFQSFQAVSPNPCKPYDKNRDGITLGEAAASILVTKNKAVIQGEVYYEILGDSNINDANHISGPSRTGEGLFQSIQKSIAEAQISANQIDCISAHGTATAYNDEMEAQAFNRLGLENTPVYSLKGYFGHTLGASGLLDTVIALKSGSKNLIPQSLGYSEHGVTLPLNVTTENIFTECNIILKTASGFGGTNTAVIFKRHINNEK